MANKTRGKGLYLRGNTWWIRYADPTGRIIRESTGKILKGEAQVILTSRWNEVDNGKTPDIKKIKNHFFKELANDYIEWAQRQRSFDSKKYLIQDLVNEFGNCPLRGLNTRVVEQYQTKKLTTHKPATANRLLATLKHMIRKATEWDMVGEDVLKKVRMVKLEPENNRRLRYLSKEECQELIKACSPHLKPIVITALNTGMRKGEILSLKWDNVDLKHGFILLDITKNGERREIPINTTLRETFNRLVRRIDSPYVFIDSWTGSNRRPLECHSSALPTELQPQNIFFH